MAIKTGTIKATKVSFQNEMLAVELNDGRIIQVPLAWFPRLAQAKSRDLENWRFIGDGEGINWPTLDEDLSVEGILRGA